MIRNNLPVLIVLVPLLGALVAPLLGTGRRAWAWASLVASTTFGIALALLLRAREGPWSYPMGSWRVPWGIELRVDLLSAFVLGVVAGIGCVVTLATAASVRREIPGDRLHFFYSVWLLGLAGLLGMTVTGDAFNVYVLLEVTSLATYVLVAMGKDRDRRALPASLHYLVYGTLGACFLLVGIGCLYMVTGTLNMADMAVRLRGLTSHRATVATAFAFLMTGIALKTALVPLHAWLPNAYAYAPSAVSALLSGTATKVGAYLALRFLFTVFGAPFSFSVMPAKWTLLACGSVAVIYGSYRAIHSMNLKKLLAWSSVAQIGYIALGIGIATERGVQAGVLHLFNHAIVKSGLFLALAAVVYRLGSARLGSIRGLGRRMPLTAAALTAGGLGLVGIPGTAGFVSKWHLAVAAIQSGNLLALTVILAGSALALVYVWRVVEVLYDASDGPQPVEEAPAMFVLGVWILIGASFYFGIHSTPTSTLSAGAARLLWGGGP